MKKFKEFYNFPYADLNSRPGANLNASKKHEIKVGNYTTKFFFMCGSAQKELKKVYKNKKDANDYMAAIMIAKGGG